MTPFKSLISAKQLSPTVIEQLFPIIDDMANQIRIHGRIDLLEDKVIALLFFEPSSRTMMSFQSAAQRLKAGMVFAQNAASTSLQKGESLEDLIRMVESYSDLIVMRHAMPGSASIAAATSSAPFINAGDGGNEHPTQALIDVYTLHKKKGRLNKLNIVFGFDSLQSRSIRSLSRLLAQYPGNRFTFTGPSELDPSSELLEELRSMGAECQVSRELDLKDGYDVAYVNRLQQERFSDPKVFEKNRRKYRVSKDSVENSNCIILDPLPRIDEIDTEVDDLPNAVYFEQASYGVPVRMALLALLLGKY